MKKWLTLLLAIPIALCTSAQQKFFEEKIGWKGKKIELHTISDVTKQRQAMFLLSSDSVCIFVMDKNEAIIQHFYILRDEGEDFLGGFIKDNQIYAFFQATSGTSDLHSWTFDIVAGIGDDNHISFAMKHERAVDKISCGDHFLFFSVNRKASEFIIYEFRDATNYDSLRYQFEPNVWRTLTKAGGFSRDINVIKIDPDGECNADMAKTPNKLYWVHDTLYLLMNTYERGVTTVFGFDVPNKKVSLRKIVHNNVREIEPPVGEYEDNSMLLDDKLYFVSAEANRLNIQVRDFYSARLLHEYSVGRDEEIPFKNTPIIQEGGAYSKHDTRELDKTRQLLRKMLNGDALIIARREDSGRVGLTIGSYKKMTSNGGGFGVMSPIGGVASGLHFAVGVGVGGFFRNSWSKSARFKTLMDSTTSEHLPGLIESDITERIIQYTDGISIPEEGENLFRNSGRYVYAYYSRDEHKLMLVNF